MKTTFYYLSHVSIGAMHDVVAFQAQGQKIGVQITVVLSCGSERKKDHGI